MKVLVQLRVEYTEKLRAVHPDAVRVAESYRSKLNVLQVAIARLCKTRDSNNRPLRKS